MFQSVQRVIDSIPLKPPLRARLQTAAVNGDKLLRVGKRLLDDDVACGTDIAEFVKLKDEVERLYAAFTLAAGNEQALADIITPEGDTFVENRIIIATIVVDSMASEMVKVLNIRDLDYIKMQYADPATLDISVVADAFNEYETGMKEIEAKAATIKKRLRKESNKTDIVDSVALAKPLLSNTVLDRTTFDITMYVLLPDLTQVILDRMVTEILYTRDFDNMALPIYSMRFKVPHNLAASIRESFSELRWFITINARPKATDTTESMLFNLTTTVVDNAELTAIDPQYYPSGDQQGTIEGSFPSQMLKIDFVPKRDSLLNANTKVRVFTDCTLLDVITALGEDVARQYQSINPDERTKVKFAITPPDNLQTYEQILVQPGSFTDTLYDLQSKYGVYMTGIRVSFDSKQLLKEEGSTEVTAVTYVTITDKGGTAPSEKSINQVYIELVDPRYVELPFYESGSALEKNTSTLLIRSFLPYLLYQSNSELLTKGTSVKVLQNSMSDNLLSVCDLSPSEDSIAKTYWSNYDNPYAITQLQDSIREQSLMLQCELHDINLFALNDNLKYMIKFYSKDDISYTGEYRIKTVSFDFVAPEGGSNLLNIELQGVLMFANAPRIRINGAPVERPEYKDRVTALKNRNQENSGGVVKINPVPKANVSNSSTRTATKSPFRTNFAGKRDFYNVEIPAEIPDAFAMSSTIKFIDVYDHKDGRDYSKASGMANNFPVFINAQRFSKEILDPLNGMFSKNGTGKLNSFYRYGIPAGGSKTSQHLVALACDAMWGGAGGDPLADAFYKIATSALDFDQIILEGNGKQWRWIHVGKVMNGSNRKQILIAENALAGNYKRVNMSKFTAGDKLYWSNFKKTIF